jgi:hypothetical protein
MAKIAAMSKIINPNDEKLFDVSDLVLDLRLHARFAVVVTDVDTWLISSRGPGHAHAAACPTAFSGSFGFQHRARIGVRRGFESVSACAAGALNCNGVTDVGC